MAQKVRYSIDTPPGAREGPRDLPTSIDTNHYYTYLEIRNLPKPSAGWSDFYEKMDSLDYPPQAKKQKLQTSMTIFYQIDEYENLDSVSVQSIHNYGKWTKCGPCETQILDFIRQTQWSAGKINDTHVKSEDWLIIEYSIFDPKDTSSGGYFGH